MGAVLGDDDIVVCTTGNGIVIASSSHEVRDDDEQHVSEEVIQVLQTAHHMSLSTRNMLKLERNCTRRELLDGRSKLLPYVATALEVSSGVVSRRSAVVCPLLEVVQSQLTWSRACGMFSILPRPPLDYHMRRCHTTVADVGHQVHNPRDRLVGGVAAAGVVRRWATWWALHGPDDTHCLLAIDTKANLN